MRLPPSSPRVRLFGPPRAECGAQVTHLTSLKEVALLGLLAVGRAEQTRESLLALLWPDSSPAAARKNLRNALWSLRRLLGEDALKTRGDHLTLAQDLWVDARHFEAAGRLLRLDDGHGHPAPGEGGEAALEQVLELHTGPFLEGIPVPEEGEFDAWLRTQRDRLGHVYLEALTRAVQHAAARGAWAQIPSLAGRALAQDPLLEPLHGALMEAYVHLGQRGEALRQFGRLRETLAREFGLEPSPAILALHARIVAGDLGGLAPAVGSAPRAAGPEPLRLINLLPLDSSQRFFGRERERAELARLLRERPRLLGVYGRGGVGKTALVCRALLDLQAAPESFPYAGVVSLGPTTTGVDWARVVGDLGRLLPEPARAALLRDTHQPGQAPGQLAHALLDHLRGGRFLLLLDEAERLLDPVSGEVADRELRALLTTVLRQGGPLTVLHSSRAPWPIPVAWASWERSLHLTAGLSVAEGAALLRACDPDGHAGLREAGDDQLAPIVRGAAGFPRALEAVAGLLLERPLLRLEDLCGAPERFLGEATGLVVEQVLGQLPPELLRVLEGLALLGRPVPRAALASVLRPYVAEETLDNLLQRLVRSHLVQYDRSVEIFSLHTLDRDYAYRRIPTQGNETASAGPPYTRRALHLRAAAYHRSVAPTPELAAPDDAENRLREFEHLLAAGEGDRAAAVLLTLGPSLTHWGQLSRLAGLHAALHGHVADPELTQGHLVAQGRALRALGRAGEAAVHLRDAAGLAHAAADTQGEIDALLELASTLYQLGRREQWQAVTTQALTAAQALSDRARRAAALKGLGNLCLSGGDLGRARDIYREALEETRAVGDRTLEGALLYNLGLVHAELWDLDPALSLLRAALHLGGAGPNPAAEAATLGTLGSVLAGQGDLAGAFYHTQRALEIQRARGDRYGECWNLGNLGIWELLGGNARQAVAELRAAVALAREIGAESLVAFKGVFLAAALLLDGEDEEALQVAQKVRTIDEPTNNDSAALLHGLALARADRSAEAREAFEAACDFAGARLALTPGLYSAVAIRGLAEAGLVVVAGGAPEQAACSLRAAHAACAPGLLLYGQQLLGLLTQLPDGTRLAVLSRTFLPPTFAASPG
ncbi:XRE family transcriptional regulator (plasmid) [Deinococcus aetherius]|uniref:XRE family transcriptional regulator n=1 Tax=Deinococcus aetherius TaxID=200252 RepID=A0ABN6RQU9_9DEIO|nr:BTAD domain-containing putative transcriptional regulator [Deinococcus aetherius]BDP44324.1 XRE family transcriptional regulator [Deinococcus aetherius]